MKTIKRIDWEKEIQKTEEIRMKGFRTSIFGFVIASVFLLGASRINESASVFPALIMIGCFLAATIILIFTLRRAAKVKKIRDEEYEKFKENE